MIGGAFREHLVALTHLDARNTRVGCILLIHLERQRARVDVDVAPRVGIRRLITGRAGPEPGSPRQVEEDEAAIVAADRAAVRAVGNTHTGDWQPGGVIDDAAACLNGVKPSADDGDNEQEREGEQDKVLVAHQGTV